MHRAKREIAITTQEGNVLSRFIVGPGEYVIGRDAGCNIVADSELVSPRHAVLTMDRQEVVIRDLDSTNGTYIDDTRIYGSTRIWPNQKIRIGIINIALRRIKSPATTRRPSSEKRETGSPSLPADIQY